MSEPATVGDGRSFGVALAAQAVVFGRRERGWVGPLRCCSMRYLQLGTGVESEERGWVGPLRCCSTRYLQLGEGVGRRERGWCACCCR